jgi:hypothetical protein
MQESFFLFQEAIDLLELQAELPAFVTDFGRSLPRGIFFLESPYPLPDIFRSVHQDFQIKALLDELDHLYLGVSPIERWNGDSPIQDPGCQDERYE